MDRTPKPRINAFRPRGAAQPGWEAQGTRIDGSPHSNELKGVLERTMADEIEVPTEHLQESIQEEYERTEDKWVLRVALTAALLAVFAAIASLYAGHHANEAMLEQIKASDQWSYYQAKSIKSMLLRSKMDLLQALDKPVDAKDEGKLAEYAQELQDIENKARESEQSSHANFTRHIALAKAVTAFQIAIAVCAISALTKRKWLWYLSLLSGCGGLVLLGIALY